MRRVDSQKMRVYRWERHYVAPLDPVNVRFEHLQPIVDYVWADLGLEHPPKVKPLAKQNKSCWAYATRMAIHVRETGCPTWVLLHELAHSLTSNFEGHSDAHRPRFVQQYIDLVCRYIPAANKLLLLASLKGHKIRVEGL